MSKSAVNSNLGLNQPFLILLVGIPGAGKTFFGEQFAKRFNLPFINLARARFVLTDEPKFNKPENTKLNQMMAPVIESVMATRKVILIEGNLDARVDRQFYHQIARRNGYKVMTVWVQNVATTARARATKPNPKEKAERDILTKEMFDTVMSRFTSPNQQENTVVISGKHMFETQLRLVLKKMVEINSSMPQPSVPVPTEPAAKSNGRPIDPMLVN